MIREKMIIKRITILFGIVAVFGTIWMSQLIKNRGGVDVLHVDHYDIPKSLVSYRQDDDRWKDYKLGDSKYTMKSSGCITTCISSAISESDNPLNPGELVKLLSSNNVYDNEGNMQWAKLAEIPGFHAAVFDEVDEKYINECLAQNRYPIVKVHRKSLVSYHHFILIIGAEDGEYVCMDPLKDELTKLSDYSNRIYSVRYVWYSEE